MCIRDRFNIQSSQFMLLKIALSCIRLTTLTLIHSHCALCLLFPSRIYNFHLFMFIFPKNIPGWVTHPVTIPPPWEVLCWSIKTLIDTHILPKGISQDMSPQPPYVLLNFIGNLPPWSSDCGRTWMSLLDFPLKIPTPQGQTGPGRPCSCLLYTSRCV